MQDGRATGPSNTATLRETDARSSALPRALKGLDQVDGRR
jgi:hypothetical protein